MRSIWKSSWPTSRFSDSVTPKWLRACKSHREAHSPPYITLLCFVWQSFQKRLQLEDHIHVAGNEASRRLQFIRAHSAHTTKWAWSGVFRRRWELLKDFRIRPLASVPMQITWLSPCTQRRDCTRRAASRFTMWPTAAWTSKWMAWSHTSLICLMATSNWVSSLSLSPFLSHFLSFSVCRSLLSNCASCRGQHQQVL